MEAPDTDKDTVLPAHSGVAAQVNGEQKSFYDTFESLFWMPWMLCTLLGVSYAAIRSRINRKKHDATADATARVLAKLSEARGADAKRLDLLEREADRLLQMVAGPAGERCHGRRTVSIFDARARSCASGGRAAAPPGA
jgi:hypothetical protein